MITCIILKFGSRFQVYYINLLIILPFLRFIFSTYRYEQAIRIHKKITLIPSLFGGSNYSRFRYNCIPASSRWNETSFTGHAQIPFELVCTSCRYPTGNVVAAGLNLQVNFWKKNYIVLRANAGFHHGS